MSDTEVRGAVRHEVPSSAWVLGWACLAGQVAVLVERGVNDRESALVSVPLSALVVAWVSAGVLRARMVRTVLAGVVLLLLALAGLIVVLDEFSLPALGGAVSGVLALGALVAHRRSDYFEWRRRQPAHATATPAGLLALAVVVGALGGLADVPDERPRSGVHIRLGLHGADVPAEAGRSPAALLP